MFKQLLLTASFAFSALLLAHAPAAQAAHCSVPDPILQKVTGEFYHATNTVGGGLFNPKMMWGAIVDREGRLCSVFKTGDAWPGSRAIAIAKASTANDAWPGSRAIAIAKASTANDFSNDKLALSTAMLYGVSIPGGSLFGLNQSNAFNAVADDPRIVANGSVPGGIITFGGGVALYVGTQVVGGFGVSGDTSCSDHDVAYITRRFVINAHVLTAPPTNDNIVYANPVIPNTFTHPLCVNSQPPPSGDSRPAATKRR